MTDNSKVNTQISDVCFIQAPRLKDERGFFRKIFSSQDNHESLKIPSISEIFYTDSKPGIIRGIHVQVGEAANYRYVFVLSGEIYDVIVDLRPESPSYGEIFTFLFESKSDAVLVLPPGVGHGFQSLTRATVGYITSTSWRPELDTGVNPFSLDLNWPKKVSGISDRDIELPLFSNWESHIKSLDSKYES
jgi:dTDP-4-dehydrorhamnose 3,5-epimerase